VHTATLPENTVVVTAERPVRPRLTRRGQGLLLALLLAAIFTAGLAFGAAAHGADSDPPPPAAHRTVVVQPGQTLWALARQVSPQRDPRVVVESIRQLNALRGAGIQAGQELLLP
jgi:LysM domain